VSDISKYLPILLSAIFLLALRSVVRHIALKMTSNPTKDQWAISPFFRVLAAIFVAAFSYVLWQESIALLSVEGGVTPVDCGNKRRFIGKLVCGISNSSLSSLPENLQGPAEGATGILFVLFLLYVIWLLLKPIFKKKHGK
jgi:hypothetical protein